MDINEGNAYDAILFAQIVYWHERDEDNRRRLRLFSQGHFWLAKNHNDWYSECGIKGPTARKCLDRLRKRGLIHYQVRGFKGDITPWIRLNWDVFEKLLNEWLEKEKERYSESPEYVSDDEYPIVYEYTPDTTGQGSATEDQDDCDDVSGEVIHEITSNTEITTVITTETTTNIGNPPPAATGSPQVEPGFYSSIGAGKTLDTPQMNENDRKTNDLTELEMLICGECGTPNLTGAMVNKLNTPVKYWNPFTKQHELETVNNLYSSNEAYCRWIKQSVIVSMNRLRGKESGRINRTDFIKRITDLSEFGTWWTKNPSAPKPKQEIPTSNASYDELTME